MDGWMDNLRFYVLFNSISVIPGRWEVDNEGLCAMDLCLLLRRFRLEQESNSVRQDTGKETEENFKKKTRIDFTRTKKQTASHRAQSKEYEITRSLKLNKYPKHDAYLLHRARDIRQLTWPFNIGQGKMWVRHWEDMIYKEVYAKYYALSPYCY